MAVDTSSFLTTSANASPDTVKARRRIAELLAKQGADTSPVQHWTQGLARIAHALTGGHMMWQADQEDKAAAATAAAELADWRSKLLGGGNAVPPAAPAPATTDPLKATGAAPMGAKVAQALTAPTTGKVYTNDEPSPLDPPSGAEQDLMARLVLAEAGNQGPVGMQAVAEVIRNRAVHGGFGGDTPAGVMTQRGQFEPMMTAGGRAKMAGIDPNSPQYQQALAAIEQAYRPETNVTGGATHFYSPKAQAALGRPAPRWDDGTGVDIGDHRFFGGAPQLPTQVASLAPPDMPLGGPTAAVQTPSQPAAPDAPAPVQVAQATPQGAPPADPLAGAPANVRAAIASGLQSRNPQVQREAFALALQYLKPPQPTDDIKEFERAQRDPAFKQFLIDMKKAGKPETNVSLSTEKRGQELMVTRAVEGFEKSQSAAIDANKRIASYGQLARAAEGFKPGATADMRLQAQRILKDMGWIKGDNVPPAEMFKSVQRRLELAATPKGQGQITENERALIRETVPSITTSPEAIPLIIGALERLDRYEIEVARIYRDSAKANGGVPNYLEVSEKIAALGPPMTDDEVLALQALKGRDTSASPPPGQPVRVNTPEEARKLPSGTPILLPDGSIGRVP